MKNRIPTVNLSIIELNPKVAKYENQYVFYENLVINDSASMTLGRSIIETGNHMTCTKQEGYLNPAFILLPVTQDECGSRLKSSHHYRSQPWILAYNHNVQVMVLSAYKELENVI